MKPSLASYARVSYARELMGDVRGAADAMRLAVEAAVGQPEALAWSQTQLGKLFWSHGRLRLAEQHYRIALAVRPGYVYALDALAQVEAAQGRLGRPPRSSGAPPRRFRCRSSSRRSATSSGSGTRRCSGAPVCALIGAIQRLLVRTASRPTSRPRSSTSTTACGSLTHSRWPGRAYARAAVDRWRRRARVGARAQRPLRRSAAPLEARAPARHARRRQVLPPRDDRALPRPRCAAHAAGSARALALNPHFSVLWAPVAQEVRGVKRLVLCAAALAALAAARCRVRSPARQLHRSTASAGSRSSGTASTCSTCWIWPRSRPSRRAQIDARSYARRIARGAQLTVNGRRAHWFQSRPRSRIRRAPAG